MIRDPSDGTVKEKPEVGIPASTSGLPMTKGKAEYLARLEKSREWLRNRFQLTTERSENPPRSPEQGEG